MDPAVVGDGLDEPLDGDPEPAGVPVPQQRLEEGVLGLDVEVGEGVGVGRVAGLRPLGLRHPQLVEEDLLQLLGAAEVDVVAPDGLVGVELGLAHLRGEVGLERGEGVLVDGDAGALHLGEDVDERQLEVAEQLGAAGLLDLLGEHHGQLEHRPGPHHGVAGRGVVTLLDVEGQRALAPLVRGGVGVGGQLAPEVAHDEVLEVVGALVRADEVGRQGGVADDPAQRQPPRGQRLELGLGVVEHLRGLGVGEPRGEHGVLLGGERREVEVRGGAVLAREGDRPGVPGAGPVLARDDDAVGKPPPDGTVTEAHREVVGGEHVSVELEAALDLVGLDLEGLEQPIAEHAELEAVEDLVHLLAVPGRALEVGDAERQLEVVDEPVEAAVAQHVVEVRAEVLARLALDLVGVPDDAGEVAVLGDPLRGGLRADPGDARQVVARLPDQRGEIAVPVRGHEVLLLDGRRVHPPHLGDPAHRVDEGDLVADELEGIAVTRADDDLSPGLGGLPGQ